MGNWTPGKVVACQSCHFNLWTSTPQNPVCPSCEKRNAETDKKRRDWTAHYQKLKREGRFNLKWAVIDCWGRGRFTVKAIAEILAVPVDTVQFQLDIARQDAQ